MKLSLETIPSVRVRKKRSAIGDGTFATHKWSLPIQYYIGPFLNYKAIYDAIGRIESKTCIRFQQTYVWLNGYQGFNFYKRQICDSPIGPGTRTKLNNIDLNNGCFNNPDIIEILIGKMLGLQYTHNRPDRDTFLDVNFNNLNTWDHYRFTKLEPNKAKTYGTPFDYGSGVMYRPKDFSRNGQNILTPKLHPLYIKMMGHQRGLSFVDYKILNDYYCDNRCQKPLISCQHDGYIDTTTCNKCHCPNGFGGNTCQGIQFSSKECGETRVVLNETRKSYINILSKQNLCYVLVTSPPGTKMNIEAITVITEDAEFCTPRNSFEIKYRKSKDATGICLCGNFKNFKLESEGNEIVLRFEGTASCHMAAFAITYK
uniref:Metalloendopeptidase n=1 Tax=Parastrongyloides trichosuri TaxID=131310 RepID=A0A0N4Z8H0_PARTI